MGSNIFSTLANYGSQAAQPIDPTEQYRKIMSLRDMIEQRKFQELSRQEQQREWAHQQQLWQQAEQDRQQLESGYRAIGADPTLVEDPTKLYGQGPGVAPLIKNLQDTRKANAELAHTRAQTAQEEAGTAQKRQDVVARFKQNYLAGIASIRTITDPAERTAAHAQLIANLRQDAGKYWDQDFESLVGTPVPEMGDDAGFNRLGLRVMGPKGWQHYTTAGATEADRAAGAILDRGLKRAQTENLTNPPAGEEERKFLSVFLPGWLETNRITNPTAADKMRAWQDFKKAPETMNNPDEVMVWMNQPGRTPQEKDTGQAIINSMTQYHTAVRPQAAALPGYGSPTENTNLTGEAFLKTLSPAAAAEIRGMAEGRLTAPTASSRAAGAQQKRAALMQYDPTFSEQRAQIRKQFTLDPILGNINTAIVHTGRLADTAVALGNGNFKPGNEMYQYFADKFGADSVTKFEFLRDAVAGELASALKGNATDPEIANMKKSIQAANSPAQMFGVVQEAMSVLSDKAKTYDDRYHRENPDDAVWSPILPTARDTLNKFRVPYTGSARGAKPPAPPTPEPPIGTVKNYNGAKYYYKGGGAAKAENWVKMTPSK